MAKDFGLPDFIKKFPNDVSCLDEIKKLKFPDGIFCELCKKITKHYKIKNRKAYTCKYCRHQKRRQVHFEQLR